MLIPLIDQGDGFSFSKKFNKREVKERGDEVVVHLRRIGTTVFVRSSILFFNCRLFLRKIETNEKSIKKV